MTKCCLWLCLLTFAGKVFTCSGCHSFMYKKYRSLKPFVWKYVCSISTCLCSFVAKRVHNNYIVYTLPVFFLHIHKKGRNIKQSNN